MWAHVRLKVFWTIQSHLYQHKPIRPHTGIHSFQMYPFSPKISQLPQVKLVSPSELCSSSHPLFIAVPLVYLFIYSQPSPGCQWAHSSLRLCLPPWLDRWDHTLPHLIWCLVIEGETLSALESGEASGTSAAMEMSLSELRSSGH